jgi:GNAT superfamily N-acetyltransferase
MSEDIRLRALDPERDQSLLERLWEAALGAAWPLMPGALDLVRGGLVAERRTGGERPGGGVGGAERVDREGRRGRGGGGERVGRGVGVVAVDPAGSIPLLLVDPAYQRQGIGTRLLEAGMARLGELGATTVGLGSGGDDYIGPGVPRICRVRFGSSRRGGGSSTTR